MTDSNCTAKSANNKQLKLLDSVSGHLFCLNLIENISLDEYIEIADVVFFVLNIFYRMPQTGIPTNSVNPVSSSNFQRLPEFNIHRRFSQFVLLRQRLVEAVNQEDHSGCAYCCRLWHCIQFTTFPDKFALSSLIFSRDKSICHRQRDLEIFINTILVTVREAAQVLHRKCAQACQGYKNSCAVLREFLSHKSHMYSASA